MNSVDARHHLRANGAEHVTAAWYINNHMPITSWSKDVIYRGFDLTLDEFLVAEAQLVTLLKENELWKLKGTGQERKIKLWEVIKSFEANCGFWNKDTTSYGVEIPGWWKRDCLDGWIAKVQRYIRENPSCLQEDTPAKKKRFRHHSTSPAKKRRTKLKDLRDCCLVVRRRYTDEILMYALAEFEVGMNPDLGKDIALNLLNITTLQSVLKNEMKYDEASEKVVWKGAMEMDATRQDIEIKSDTGFRAALTALRGEGEAQLDLEVVRRE